MIIGYAHTLYDIPPRSRNYEALVELGAQIGVKIRERDAGGYGKKVQYMITLSFFFFFFLASSSGELSTCLREAHCRLFIVYDIWYLLEMIGMGMV